MRHEFASSEAVPIAPGPPAVTSAPIEVVGIADGAIAHLSVSVDLDHHWRGDLELSLRGPNGTRVVLARRRGGRGDVFRKTVFDSAAPVAIADAVPPFAGRFRPLGDLADLHGCHAEGSWTLEVDDRAFHDAGAIRSWGLSSRPRRCRSPRSSSTCASRAA